MMRVLDKKVIADLMTTLWNSWNNRNNFIFRGNEDEARIVWERTCTLSQNFCICNLLNEPLLSLNQVAKKWQKPPKGFIKINFDALVCEDRVGYGVIARDDEGFVLGGGGGFIKKTMSVEEAECHAFEASIKTACQLNINGDVLFETDNVGLVNKLKNQGIDITIIGARIKVCKEDFNNFNLADLIWTRRSSNVIVDLISTKCAMRLKLGFLYGLLVGYP
ncbi:hypothetical protein Gotri_006982 [Gossypium trilobum]|uniref:RNase H type-1 domain-containing protein n=1 Tax=Gossypium trilobum TaxID=34281 RepID=A0A7J9EEK8_9ROSI|nr:hypothetical protein [Gossypium trilobum]